MSTREQNGRTKPHIRLATLPTHIRRLSRGTRSNRNRDNDNRLEWTGEVRPGQPGAMRRVGSSYSVDVRTILRSRPVGRNGNDKAADTRRVYVNTPTPPHVTDQHGSIENKIRTTKYTFWTFIPKNLFEQFRRAANIYFLFMAVIQIIPYFQVNNPGLTLFPISFVLVVTASKDGFEDWKRYQQDKAFNGTPTSTLQRWRNVNLEADDTEGKTMSWYHRLIQWFRLARPQRTARYHRTLTEDGGSGGNEEDIARDVTRAESNTEDPAKPTPVVDDEHTLEEHTAPRTSSGHRSTTSNQPTTGLLTPSRSRDPANAAFLPSIWQDIRVGDIVYINGDEPIPADVVVLATSEPDGECYVETKSLDGETNLKTRSCVPETIHLESAPECARAQLIVESEAPSSNLYVYRGTLHIAKPEAHLTPELMELLAKHANSNDEDDDEDDYEGSRGETNVVNEEDERTRARRLMRENFTSVQLDLNNMLLRGCFLRNTKWAIGVVVFAGAETKILLNSGVTPSKRSRIEKTMNYQVIINFVFLSLLSIGCAIGYSIYYHEWGNEGTIGLFAPYDGSIARAAVLNLLAALIVFQNIIPISLYISIEFVKTFHWNISDDLGQVEYVFSDKTGTLTRNIMEFQKCSIRSHTYGDESPNRETEVVKGMRLRSNDSFVTGIGLNEQAAMARERELKQQFLLEMQRTFRPRYATVDPQKLTFADPQLFIDLRLNELVSPEDSNDEDNADDKLSFGRQYDSPEALSVRSDISQTKGDISAKRDDIDDGEKGDIDKDEKDEKEKVAGSDADNNSIGNRELSPTSSPGLQHPLQAHLQITESHSSRNSFSRATSTSSAKQSSSKSAQGNDFATRGHGIREFFTLLALCHTVIVERPDQESDDDKSPFSTAGNEVRTNESSASSLSLPPQPLEIIRYRAESPDEDALVSAARDVGFTFLGRRRQELLVDILGVQYTFEQLNLLPFDSTRKRMSVIVRRPSPWNDIVIYTKGADNVILERLASGQDGIVRRTQRDIERYSQEGLRVLLLAYRRITTEEYEEWQRGYHAASTSFTGRDALLDACAEEIEQNLTLIGATAIEDRLQDRVPETIESLRKAGMKVWVLTGDKLETAINIGYSCSLLTQNMRLWTIRGNRDAAQIIDEFIRTSRSIVDIENERAQGHLTNGDTREHALVIDGQALKEVLHNPRARRYLLSLATRCRSVICCRVSPLQKAQVVHLVRKGRHAITLAIGDGANDVSMIQAANVGVAITGQEGLQASMASDYTIGQFRYLKPLLLVHGQWSYLRVAEMILNFFYKNILYALVVFFYQIYCGFSSNIFYDYVYVQLYNLVFTLLPVIILGCTDQIVNAPRALHYPYLYRMGIDQTRYNMRRFWIYTIESVAHAAAIFFIFYGVYKHDPPTMNGYAGNILDFSTVIITTVIIVASLVVGLNTYSWNWFMHVAVWGSALLPIAYLAVASSIQISPLYGVGWIVFAEANFWLPLILTIVIVILPRFLYKYCKQNFFAEDVDIVREMQKYHLDGIKSQQYIGHGPGISYTDAITLRDQQVESTTDDQQPDLTEMTEVSDERHHQTGVSSASIHDARGHSLEELTEEIEIAPSQPSIVETRTTPEFQLRVSAS